MGCQVYLRPGLDITSVILRDADRTNQAPSADAPQRAEYSGITTEPR